MQLTLTYDSENLGSFVSHAEAVLEHSLKLRELYYLVAVHY